MAMQEEIGNGCGAVVEPHEYLCVELSLIAPANFDGHHAATFTGMVEHDTQIDALRYEGAI